MSENNPQDEPNKNPLEDAKETQMIPDDVDFGDTPSTRMMPEDAEYAQPDETGHIRVISFYLPSRSEPIMSRDATITLGRRDPKRKINPTIDLTEEGGAQLGVSRLHAEINFQNGRYHLKDMGSANGTWINNSKLAPYQPHPIDTGDQIRLGQLALLIHITMPQRSSKNGSKQTVDSITGSSYSFRLVPTADDGLLAHGGFSPEVMEAVTTVLKSVRSIIEIIRAAQEEELEDFTILRTSADGVEDAVLVDVKGGADVTAFLANKLPLLLRALQGDDSVTLPAGLRATVDSATLDEYHTLNEKVAEVALQETVNKFLADERKSYVQQLVPHFEALITCALVIAPSE